LEDGGKSRKKNPDPGARGETAFSKGPVGGSEKKNRQGRPWARRQTKLHRVARKRGKCKRKGCKERINAGGLRWVNTTTKVNEEFSDYRRKGGGKDREKKGGKKAGQQ